MAREYRRLQTVKICVKGRQRKHHCMFLKRLAPLQSLFNNLRSGSIFVSRWKLHYGGHGAGRLRECMRTAKIGPDLRLLFEDSRRFEFVKPSSLKWLATESLLRQEMDSAYWPLTSDVDGIYSLWCNPETKKNVTNKNFTTTTPTRLQKKERNIHLKTQTSALGNKKDKGISPNASLSRT